MHLDSGATRAAVTRRASDVLLTACIILVCVSALKSLTAQADFVDPPKAPGQVVVYRDNWGVPHVYALTDEDALFGAGYALAQDNLEGILRAYVRTLGTSASVFGPDELKLDIFNRRWRVNENAREAFDGLSAPSRARLSAYVAGIQRYLDEHPRQRPAWTPMLEPHLPVAAAHSLALLMSVMQARQGNEDCEAEGIQSGLTATATAPADMRSASNQWVVMPERTRGKALMLWADSHSDFTDYFAPRDEIRIHGQALHTSGVQAAGIPYPVIAATPQVAWAMAAGGPDVSDCYKIEVDPSDARRYRFDGEWRSIASRTETFVVHGQENVTVRFESLRLNDLPAPVVARQGNYAFALSSSYANRAGALIEQLYAMNIAKGMEQFKAAMAMQGMFPQNNMAGDANGSAYYVLAGYTPIRPDGFDWSRPVPGNSGTSAWLGFHPAEDLVQIENPKAGYMINTNIASDAMMPGQDLKAADYPAYIFNDVPGRMNERGLRAGELLAAANRVTESDMLEIGFDEKLYYTGAWQKALREALLNTTELDVPETEFAADLLGFNGFMRIGSVTALRFYYWREAVQATAAAQRLKTGDLAKRIEAGNALSPPETALLIKAISQALLQMRQRHGNGNLVAGEVFRIGRSERHWPVGGFGAGQERTLRAMSCAGRFDESGRCLMVFGQRHPILTVFGKPVRIWSAVPAGQSRDRHSRHYADQGELASERSLKPVYLSWESLKPVIESSLLLERPESER